MNTDNKQTETPGVCGFRDTFDRVINYLRISVTDRCNLRCVYCMPKKGISLIGHDDILRYEELLRIARIAVGGGIRKIRITGGEPLVRRGITGFIESLSGLAHLEEISLTTNGILLQAAAAPLRAAGLKRINISLDSLNPRKFTTITRGGSLQSVLDGIREAQAQGFEPIKINAVVMKGINDDEVLSFARLTMDRPIHIRFIELMPVNNRARWNHTHFISNDEIRTTIEACYGDLVSLASEQGAGPASMFQIKTACGKLGFISPLSNHFCATCNRLRLTADGQLRSCLFSDTETDLKTPLRTGCSDESLTSLIDRAVLAKPRQNRFIDATLKKCTRTMSAIGG